MTRETKIGLLVSLAFVIAVGVLLSDHMVNNTDAKPIAVAKAGPEVAKALAVPGQPVEGVAIPLKPDANPVPVQPVPTVGDITAPVPDAGKSSVVVGPAPAATGQIEISANPNVPQRQTEIHISPTEAPNVTGLPDAGTHVATLGGPAPLTMADPMSAATTQPASAGAAEAEKKYQDYVAVSGDNVAKWAKKFLGADTKANRELIIAANDVLKKDPTKIVVGKTYRIPLKQTAAPAVAAAPAPAATAARPTESASTPATKTYVVKSGDNLWKIAKGNEKLISEIRKLNRDAFKDGNLKVGATLRMPAKNAG